jgi:hypothetical protein
VNLGTDREAAIEPSAAADARRARQRHDAEMWRLYQTTQDWRTWPATQTDYTQCSVELLRVFGTMRRRRIRALHVRRYLRKERADAPVRANREAALLSNLLNVAIDQGDVEENVCRHVRRNKERPRSMAPEAQTLERFTSWAWRAAGRRPSSPAWPSSPRSSGSRRIEFRPMAWPQVGPT